MPNIPFQASYGYPEIAAAINADVQTVRQHVSRWAKGSSGKFDPNGPTDLLSVALYIAEYASPEVKAEFSRRLHRGAALPGPSRSAVRPGSGRLPSKRRR